MKSPKEPVRAPDEVQYYDWRLTRWNTSETRERLDAAGRGIYRELLDQCYAQGRFPDDAEWISHRCACTVREYKKWWSIIERHFPKFRNSGYRHNVYADIWRKQYFQLCATNRTHGKTGGVKSGETRKLRSERRATAQASGQPPLPENSQNAKPSKEVSKEVSNKSIPLPDDGTLPLNGNRQFYEDRQAAWEWFVLQYPGELNPEWDGQIFVGAVQVFEDIARLRANLPLWKSTRKWMDGFSPTAENFLKKRQFKNPPKPELAAVNDKEISYPQL